MNNEAMADEERPDSVETEARELEDAIAEGLARLGLSRDQVDVEVLEEGKGGFLGIGARNARVRVSSKRRKRPNEASVVKGRGQAPGRARESAPPRTREAAPPREREPRERESSPEREPSPVDESMVKDVVQQLITSLDESAKVSELAQRSGRFECEIETAEPALLLGRRGRTLDALQTLATALVARRAGDRVKVNLDIGGFRARRKEVLVAMASEAADDAVRLREDIHLEAMSAHERKIIHSALAQNPEIATESIDNGDRRHVVVLLKGSSRSGARSPRSGRSDRDDRGGRGGRGGDRRRGRGGRGGGRRDEREAEAPRAPEE